MNARVCLGISLPAIMAVLASGTPKAQGQGFHGAPVSAKAMKNPYAGQRAAIRAGRVFYGRNCGACHGSKGQGTGNIPALAKGPAQSASDGEIFWFITRGNISNGMPAWKSLPEKQRWQIIAYVKSLRSPHARAANTGK